MTTDLKGVDPSQELVRARLLMETVDAVRYLAGALIDCLPPQAQNDLADVQVKLLKAVEAFHNGVA